MVLYWHGKISVMAFKTLMLYYNDMAYNKEKLIERIKRNILILQNGCWLWTKYVNKNGYGEMCIYKEKDKAAHRWSYRLFVGEIPKGMFVCHKCDNRKCINPKHLFLGTAQDNIKDMHEKNRWCDRKGSKHPMSKLNKKDIKNILRLHEVNLTNTLIAKKYSINQSTISRIVNNKTGYTGGSRK